MHAAPLDLEAFERAYRLRTSADDGLLRQVFGEERLEELTTTRPGIIETARTYFPHLTASTYERLSREPDLLQMEKERCEREMEQLAVQNYGAFIGSAKVTQAVRQEVASIQKHLENMSESLVPIQDEIQVFQTFSAGLVNRRAALRNVLQQHSTLLELLELPQLLDACIRNQMYEESLELLAFCGNVLQAHEARGEEIPVLSKLREQVAAQRACLQQSLVAQLATDIHLPACVRVIGFLRRAQRHSEEELRRLFVEHRGNFLERHKQQVELLRASRGNAVTALKTAADLLRTHVHDIGTQYQALFQQEDGPLVAWLNEQIAWLTGLLRAHVLPEQAARGAPGGPATATAGSSRMDAASLMLVLRQVSQASAALKRLGGHFLPAVAGLFDARMEHHVCEMLDLAMLNFHGELGRYDWVPSTALTSSAAAAAASPGVGSASAAGWLHPQALELTRHRPLAVFTNDLVQVFNELRQCPLHGLRGPVVTQISECLSGAINLLRSVLASHTLPVGSAKAQELSRLCRHFAEILIPLMAAHLEMVFGPTARLDSVALIASMAPDLLPPETDFSISAEADEAAAPADPAPPPPAPPAPPVASAAADPAPDASAADAGAPADPAPPPPAGAAAGGPAPDALAAAAAGTGDAELQERAEEAAAFPPPPPAEASAPEELAAAALEGPPEEAPAEALPVAAAGPASPDADPPVPEWES